MGIVRYPCPREGAAWCSTVTCSRCLMGSADSTPLSSSDPMPRRRSFSGGIGSACDTSAVRLSMTSTEPPTKPTGSSGRGWASWWCSTSSRRLRGPRPPPRARRTATLPRPKRNRLGSRPVGWSGATSRASRWERPRRRSSTTAIGWHAAVAGAGYVPGVYVGFHCGLDATQLYRALRFSHYWGAYNLNADEMPIVRGLQMKQSLCKPPDAVPGHTFEFQVDTVRADALGGHPTLVARDGWRA